MAENEKTLLSYHVKDFQFKLIFMLKKHSRVISFTLTTNEQFWLGFPSFNFFFATFLVFVGIQLKPHRWNLGFL